MAATSGYIPRVDAIWTFGDTLDPARVEDALDALFGIHPGICWAPADGDDAAAGRFFIGFVACERAWPLAEDRRAK